VNVWRRESSMNWDVGIRPASSKRYLRVNKDMVRLRWESQYIPSAFVPIDIQSTTHDRPRTCSAAFIEVNLIWIVFRVPVAELFVTGKTNDVVLVFEAWVKVEAGVRQSLRSRNVRGRMRPFHQNFALVELDAYAIEKGAKPSLPGLHRERGRWSCKRREVKTRRGHDTGPASWSPCRHPQLEGQ
jgi:hypothetical protein